VTIHLDDIMRDTASADLRSDVRIGQYWTPDNLELVQNYIFTWNAPDNKFSSVKLLSRFCDAYAPGARGNRFVVIATYGHGKSHFALVLANYFGKPDGSVESNTVLSAIKHAIPDQDLGEYGHLEAFKRHHKPYLILILRGDEPSDLRTKFYRAVKEALGSEKNEGDETQLPFWQHSAHEFLQKIEARDRANAFLSQRSLDLDALTKMVRDGQAAAYDECVELFEYLYGVPPNFEIGLSLKDALDWLVKNKCGADNPYEGVLVLFDEFSTFVEEYAQARSRGTLLQDLLNGIAEAPERASFIAFAQADPNQVARRSVGGEAQNNLLKELDRLPPEARFQLHSSLEEVLESYLRKGGQRWLELLSPGSSFASALDDATTQTLQLYKKRYLDELRWHLDTFHSIVTTGCYPLHPLTTAIFCSVDLRLTAGPRAVLGFVREQVRDRSDEEIQTEAGPNWVRAVALVDYFGDMLADSDKWQSYGDALSQIRRADEREEALVLQAMLLHEAAALSTANLSFDKAIAQLTGLPLTVSSETLTDLSQRGIVRRDPSKGHYTLPPGGWGRGGERLVQEKLRAVVPSATDLEKVRQELVDQLGFGLEGVSVDWGHVDDWTFAQALVVRETLTSTYLAGAIKSRLIWAFDGDAREKSRGLAVWVIAKDEDDVVW
jgi:hypothetical protein